jgi:hypothetical protein
MERTVDNLLLLANGNFGAAAFLRQLDDGEKSQVILNTLEKAPSLVGSKLWVLYSDISEKDMDTVYSLCLNAPIEVLVEACSCWGNSWAHLVEQYK